MKLIPHTLVSALETFLDSYIAFADPIYRLPLALWIIGTYCFTDFDAYPYLVITSATKRSGKTRLGELISFSSSNPRNFAAMTGPTLFRSIAEENPTVLFDEAEQLNSEAASTMRSVLNVGYRKGQTIPRTSGKGIVEFPTYCPKVFILIGDVYDTLRDRSIVVTMRRGEATKRFVYDIAREEGEALRKVISASIKLHLEEIREAFLNAPRLDFLTDRDEEIWTPLFSLCQIFCSERLSELSRCAVDISTEKTAEARRYIQLEKADESADDEYAKRLLTDLHSLLLTHGKVIGSKEAVALLQEIPTAPWRRFRGKGLTIHDMASLLARFPLVKPVRLALGSGRGNQTFVRGYRLVDVSGAVKGLK